MTTHTSRNIVICSDGTGNSDVKGRGTNVFKLYEAIDIQGSKGNPDLIDQIAFYDDGVGTSENPVRKLLGAAFGYGFSENVRKLYRELVRVYEPDDKIFLFGFSRGAYTVRTLAGLINYSGILDKSLFQNNQVLISEIESCWNGFERVAFGRRNFKEETKSIKSPGETANARNVEKGFRSQQHGKSFPDVSIEFIGVWDTVAAVGTPFKELTNIIPFWFQDLLLGKSVRCARHALSIDDERLTFLPELWEKDDRVEQVWFAGVHSNVGGGYPKQGMSLEALDWMMVEAEKSGLRFTKNARIAISELRDVHGKLYDSRAGFSLYYRWRPRDIASLCKDRGIEKPKIHSSVLERIAQGTDGYSPGNLPFDCEFVGQYVQTTHGWKSWPTQDVLEAAQSLIKSAGASFSPDKSSLLDDMYETVQEGKKNYRYFVWATVAILVTLFFLPWKFALPISALFLGLIWLWSLKVDAKLDNHFSGFWSKHPGSDKSIRTQLRELGVLGRP